MQGSLRAWTIVAVVAAALILTAAAAATPEESYIAARDTAIAKVRAAEKAQKPGPADGDDAQVLALDNRALAELERQMRAIVGPVAIKGFDENSAINLATLIEGDEGFGLLDGMVYGGIDAKTRVIVTTDGLFKRWLNEHKEWWGKDSPAMPQEPNAAVRDDDFYTQAVLTDAAILQFAELPISKPPEAAFAFAMLASRTQSDIPAKADEIFIALAQGGRVFVAYTREFRAVGPIPSCQAIRDDLAKQAAAAADQNRSEALSARSDADFLKCFAEKASQQPGFAAAAKAAQALIERLPSR
jgi:hypothetical protein